MVTDLDETNQFPDPELTDSSDLVARGGDLSVERLLAAYRHGIFPWSVNPITWWSPDPRGIVELDQLHISRSLAKVIGKGVFEITKDKAFGEVIKACAEPGVGRHGVWITPEFIEAYTQLHHQGHAHSVECWLKGELVGGIYGVAVGGLFAGESMFHRANNASKVALCYLVEHLRKKMFTLFDIQMVTTGTRPLGAVEISRTDYLKRLAEAVVQNCVF